MSGKARSRFGLLLLGLLYLTILLGLNHYGSHETEAIWSRYDEVFAHLPEIQRIEQGGAWAFNDSKVAMVPGMHALYAALADWPADRADPVPMPLRALNALFALAVVFTGWLWFRALVPGAARFHGLALAGLLAFSPYVVASGLWLTTDNLGMAIFFLIGYCLARPVSASSSAAAAALAAVQVWMRHIYMPALFALLPFALMFKYQRTKVLAVTAAAVLAFLPFALVWTGATPRNFVEAHHTRFYVANVLAMCVFVAFMSALLLPMIELKPFRDFVLRRNSLLAIAAGAVLGAVFCGWDAHAFRSDIDTFQNGSLLHLLDSKLNRFGMAWLVLSRLMVVTGAGLLGLMVALVFGDPVRRFAAGMLLLHVSALCFQERPYQRYFEGPTLVLLFLAFAPYFRRNPIFAAPLLAVWGVQILVYVTRLL